MGKLSPAKLVDSVCFAILRYKIFPSSYFLELVIGVVDLFSEAISKSSPFQSS